MQSSSGCSSCMGCGRDGAAVGRVETGADEVGRDAVHGNRATLFDLALGVGRTHLDTGREHPGIARADAECEAGVISGAVVGTEHHRVHGSERLQPAAAREDRGEVLGGWVQRVRERHGIGRHQCEPAGWVEGQIVRGDRRRRGARRGVGCPVRAGVVDDEHGGGPGRGEGEHARADRDEHPPTPTTGPGVPVPGVGDQLPGGDHGGWLLGLGAEHGEEGLGQGGQIGVEDPGGCGHPRVQLSVSAHRRSPRGGRGRGGRRAVGHGRGAAAPARRPR